MSSDQPEIHRCFKCNVLLSNAEQLRHHINHVDCLTSSNAPSFPIEQPTEQPEPSSITSPSHTSSSMTTTNQSTPINKQDSFVCGLCDLQFNTISEMGEHTRSPAHREKLTILANRYATASNIKCPSTKNGIAINATPCAPLYCQECQVPLPCVSAMEAHVAGKKHQKMIAKLNDENCILMKDAPQDHLSPAHEQQTEQDSFFCEYCQVALVDRDSTIAHLKSGSHRVAMAKANGPSNLSTLPTSDELNANIATASQTPSICVRNGVDSTEITCLLRRLCLTQLLFLLYNFDESRNGHSNGPLIQSQLTTIGGVESQELLRLIREICREEFQNLIPTILQSTNNNT